MSEKPYPIKQEENLIFSFTSVGSKGRIEKLVRYDVIDEMYFNLGFGDKIGETFDIDDSSRTNNEDMIKILSTVIETIHLFFEKYPDAVLHIEGSDDLRTKFYGRIIRNHKQHFQSNYDFWGRIGRVYEKFDDEKPYSVLFITKKMKS